MKMERPKIAGQLFRSMRKERKISVKELASEIVSSSSVNKFEVGKLSLTFFNLADLLKKMNIGLDDFYHEVSERSNTNVLGDFKKIYIDFLVHIGNIYQTDDFRTLKTIAVEKQSNFQKTHDFNDLSQAATVISLLKGENKSFVFDPKIEIAVRDYFMSVSIWDSYNLSFFSNTLFLMTDQMILSITRDISDLQDNNKHIVTILINVIDFFYRQQKYAEAKQMVQHIEKKLIPFQDHLIVRFKLSFFKNLLYLSADQARIQNRNLVRTLREIGANHLASSYEEYMDKYF